MLYQQTAILLIPFLGTSLGSAMVFFTKNKINTFKSDYEKLNKADQEVFSSAKYTTILQFEKLIKSHPI